MEILKKTARIFYAIGIVGMVSPQFIYKAFGANLFPPWPGLPWVTFWAYLFTVVVIAAAVCIVLEIRGRTVSLLLGGLLLLMYCLGDIPYELFIDPYNKHLGSWANVLKELALAGGAFAIAGSFPAEVNVKHSVIIKILEKLIPLGGLFFSITMIAYGISHFLYPEFISSLVPAWVPYHIFWTYSAGVLLICGGLCIVFKIQLRLIGILMGIMIFIWLIMLHIPLAVADPLSQRANSIVSAFSALAFSGIAFAIACGPYHQKINEYAVYK